MKIYTYKATYTFGTAGAGTSSSDSDSLGSKSIKKGIIADQNNRFFHKEINYKLKHEKEIHTNDAATVQSV